MNKALRQIFWGYVFIFFRIHIGFDVLADPIGYFLILSGCSKLVEAYPVAKKAMIVAMIGAIFSLPSVFVNLSEIPLTFGWSTYSSFLLVLKMVMGYYLFIVLKDVTKVFGGRALHQRTENTFKFYVAIHLFALAIESFFMNVPEDGWAALSLLSLIGVLVIDILFLLLIGAIRRVSPEQLRVDTFI
ncbi:hypothetical protein M3152_00605 [Sporosarcina luteola]|uniref:hypothetical protein n=1 Tax=Bacillales TaxID=1385 RepID=UPI00203C945C|nr:MULTISPECIES: hypothetical protein [Bacillales]MCM3636200.1 hypothetical protein [Sporosarcina luteola]